MSPEFDPEGYQFLGRAIAALASQEQGTIADARQEMRRRLAASKTTACLFHPKTGASLKIAASAWNVDRCIPWLESGRAEITAAEWQVWRHPEQAAPVCWIYIDETSAGSPAEDRTHSVSSKSGSPGRPTSRHLAEAEFERRRKSGEIEGTLAAQAQVIAKWLVDTHPTEAPLKEQAMKNALRVRYNVAKALK